MIMLGSRPDELESPEPLVQKFQADYSLRLVGSMNELIEKVLILEEDLDDRAVEIFKVALMASIEESQRGGNPELFFSGIYVNDESEEQIEFALVNEAGTRAVSVPLKQAYRRYVDEVGKHLPTIVSECGRWLRVDRRLCPELLGGSPVKPPPHPDIMAP